MNEKNEAFVPVDGDWRVAMVWGDEKDWHGFCHPVAAWRIPVGHDVAQPVYAYSPMNMSDEEEDGDIIGDPHRAEDFCSPVDETVLGGARGGERPMCPTLRATLMNARVRAELARRRSEKAAG